MTLLGIPLSDVKMVPIKLKSRLINQPQASAFSIFSINNILNIKKVLYCSVVSNSLSPYGLYSPPGSSVHGDSPGKNTGVGCLSLFQGIFPIQELNLGLLHCRQILTVWANREIPKDGLLPRHSFQFNSSYMDYIPTRLRKTLLQDKNEFKNKPAAQGTWLGAFSKLLQFQCGMCLFFFFFLRPFTTYKCYNNLQ